MYQHLYLDYSLTFVVACTIIYSVLNSSTSAKQSPLNISTYHHTLQPKQNTYLPGKCYKESQKQGQSLNHLNYLHTK